jgi:hypothetical protein
VRNLLVGFVTVLLLVALAMVLPGTLPPSVRDLVGIGPAPLGSPPEVSGGGSHRFLQHQPGDEGAPVAYSPCEPIRVKVNPDGADDPERAREIVLDAMAEVARATGLRMQYAGDSEDRPSWRSATKPLGSGAVLGGTQSALVSFADEDEVSQLEGRVAGVGGSASVRRNGVATYVTGQVTLDTDTFNDLLRDPGGAAVARAITMHELGHLVGLDHVDDERELMYAHNRGQLDFGPGDRTGLAALGRGPCA